MNKNMTRKIPELKGRSYNYLVELLKDAKLDAKKRTEIEKLAKAKKEQIAYDVEHPPNIGYFHSDYNPFWRLAKYELYREGHPKVQMDRHQNLTCEASDIDIFDKMIEVFKKYNDYKDREKRTTKGHKNARITSELQELANRQ